MKKMITVDAGHTGSKISRDIYGHFSEHLGRCIYGGFWVGKNSQIENVDGFRKDVADAFKKINIPNLRWPGGCFADEYHWKDGIGPQIERKRMVNTHWGGVVEDNSFGTHEFLDLCELLECKPYICGNVGSGTVQEMSEWVEYITFGGESPMSKLREKNGRKNPWKLPLFGVGNESWGCGGNMRPEYYADLYRRYQTYVRQYTSDKITKIACGPNSSDYNWTEVLMREASKMMDGLSLHHYTVQGKWEDKTPATDFNEEQWYGTMKSAYFMETLLRKHDDIMSKYDPEKRIGLVVDEWGCWHAVEPGTNPGFLYQQNTVRDAVVAGLTLNIFNNHCDRVKIANLAQAVNVLQSPVLTEGDKIVLTPTWHVLEMYKDHQDADLLGTTVTAPVAEFTKGTGISGSVVSGLNVSASVKKQEGEKSKYTITVTNTDLNSQGDVEINFAGLVGNIKSAVARIVTDEKMATCNTFDKPDVVTAKTHKVNVLDKDSLSMYVPAKCVIAVTVEA